MKQTTKTVLKNLGITALITLTSVGTALIIMIVATSCSGVDKVTKNKTYFDKCTDALKPPKTVWSIFGTINIPKVDSAAVAQCKELGLRELRSDDITKHGGSLVVTDKMEYLDGGIPTKPNWQGSYGK